MVISQFNIIITFHSTLELQGVGSLVVVVVEP